MLPDDKRHGTYAGWQAHWRHNRQACEPCRLAFRAYQRRAENEKRLGYARRVPTGPIREHLLRLREKGVPVRIIAEKSGVGADTIRTLYTGPRKTMNKDLADALLGVNPNPAPRARVSPVGTVRRVQALGCLGWSYNAIAAKAASLGHPITASGIQQIVLGDHALIQVATVQAVAAAYDELSMLLAPRSRATSVVRTYASRKGWVPPLCWDDDTIDDPSEQPKGVGTSTADRADVLADVDSWGGNATDAARALGIDRATLQTWAQRHGCSELYRRLAGREAMRGNQWTEGAA